MRLNKKDSNNSIRLISSRFLLTPQGKIQGRHWLTFAGIALGVFALLTVSSVMNGFDRDMRSRIIGTRSEIRVSGLSGAPLTGYMSLIEKLNSNRYIAGYAPVIRNELMLVNGSSMAATVNFGINFSRQQKVSPVLRPIPIDSAAPAGQWQQGIIQGSANLLRFEQQGIILGVDLASDLNVVVGDTIQMVSALGSIPTPMGLMPRTATVKVTAILVAGMPEYDKLYSYVPLDVARQFSSQTAAPAIMDMPVRDYGQIDILEIKTTNPRKIQAIAAELQKDFPQFKIEDWSSFDSSLYSAMHFEKYIMLTILGLMFIIASFNMSSNIYKTIIQKKKSIGILKTIGFQNRELMQLFYFQGLVVGCSGILCGIILSSTFLLIQRQFGLIQLPVGNMPNLVLPVDLRWADFLLIPLVSFILTWFSIYLPARKAMQINPIALIRHS